ncbi:MAG: hypothetical protein A4E66_00038 [Syntrophus sp. PtaB.Bin001]|nr:MAG: hypothetical protein A4E66_00038 [Syntrophus sp. PtaB.Bin001]
MIKRFQTYIEREPWDDELLQKERYLRAVCWIVIIFAVVHFGPAFVRILSR